MQKILVTGATGFVGNYVTEALLKDNYEVIASSANEEKARSFSWFPKVRYIPFDLASFDNGIDCFAYFDRPDAVIHLAWEGLPNYKAAFHYEVNLPRHFSFLENMLQHGLRSLSVTGTCFEYGMHEGMLSEDMKPDPANAYAMAKDSLRDLIEGLRKASNFDFKWIRLFYMYGRGQHPNSLLSQLQKALDDNETVFNMSGGAQVRDYLPVETVAEYIVTIAVQQKITGIVNCCSAQPVSVRQLVENYLEERQASIHLNLGHYPYADYEPMSFWGDDSKLNKILAVK
ncbi:MAG: NAD(P)-dependent oxidoreductase [Chitinophagaceae bacterium]